ncbi:unnamed protein product [Chrysoparadoxa australica]
MGEEGDDMVQWNELLAELFEQLTQEEPEPKEKPTHVRSSSVPWRSLGDLTPGSKLSGFRDCASPAEGSTYSMSTNEFEWDADADADGALGSTASTVETTAAPSSRHQGGRRMGKLRSRPSFFSSFRRKADDCNNGMVVTQGVSMTGAELKLGTEQLSVKGTLRESIIEAGTVIIAAGACVTGDIECADIVVEGKFDGTITASNHVHIGAAGQCNGCIKYRSLHVEHGGAVEAGLCPTSS